MIYEGRTSQQLLFPTPFRTSPDADTDGVIVTDIFRRMGQIHRKFITKTIFQGFLQPLGNVFTSAVFPGDESEAGASFLGWNIQPPGARENIGCAAGCVRLPARRRSRCARRILKGRVAKWNKCPGWLIVNHQPRMQQREK